jgi:hypothetical protein
VQDEFFKVSGEVVDRLVRSFERRVSAGGRSVPSGTDRASIRRSTSRNVDSIFGGAIVKSLQRFFSAAAHVQLGRQKPPHTITFASQRYYSHLDRQPLAPSISVSHQRDKRIVVQVEECPLAIASSARCSYFWRRSFFLSP